MGREATRVRTGVGGGNVSGGRAEKGAARGASVFDKRRRSIGGRDAPLVLVVAPHPLGRGALERDRLVGLRGHRERMRGGARAAWPAIRAPSNNSRRTEPSTKRLRSRQRSPTPIFVVVARRFGLTGFADGLTVMAKVRSSQQPRGRRTCCRLVVAGTTVVRPGTRRPPLPPSPHTAGRARGRLGVPRCRFDTPRGGSRPSPRRAPPWPSTARRRRRPSRRRSRPRVARSRRAPALPRGPPPPPRVDASARSRTRAGIHPRRGRPRRRGRPPGLLPRTRRRARRLRATRRTRWRTSCSPGSARCSPATEASGR